MSHETDDSRSVLALTAAPGLQAPGTAASKGAGSGLVGEPVPSAAFAERLAAAERRVADRRPLMALKERQAEDRALEVASWGLEREWPRSRLQEAFVVAHHGPGEAAWHGGSRAGRLERPTPGAAGRGRDDYGNLRRHLALYERHYPAAAELIPGWPAAGLAVVLHIGVLGRDDPELPATLAYAIGYLGITARRMRAHATTDDPARHRGQVARARARRTQVVAWGFAGAAGTNWPAWVELAPDGLPAIRLNQRYQQELVTVDPDWGRPPTDRETLEVLRDAILLRHDRLECDLDGRTQMALRHSGALEPQIRLADVDPRVLELNRLTGAGLDHLVTLSPGRVAELLTHAQARRARQRAYVAAHSTDHPAGPGRL